MEIKEEKSRFVLLNDQGEEAGEITWSSAGDDLMIVDHTFVDPTYRGQKLAEKLVLATVEKARRDDQKILPLCPFAKKEFNEKPEYADVWRK
ncbi:GNAT family acetyltransferase [Enterococcus canis]|uniref:GNAT family acetyltransferase n=1 Tax=Enterococcus canis TaxID=214095 RepID=A0A1L8RK33_9ENTE|nr:GNAT family N-acetyltransferase [Enterococcus canis]OJG20098.1 GNAT family acetyltransferase [Enterococcus canis]